MSINPKDLLDVSLYAYKYCMGLNNQFIRYKNHAKYLYDIALSINKNYIITSNTTPEIIKKFYNYTIKFRDIVEKLDKKNIVKRLWSLSRNDEVMVALRDELDFIMKNFIIQNLMTADTGFKTLQKELSYLINENEKNKEKIRMMEKEIEQQSINEILKNDDSIHKEMMIEVIDPKDKSSKLVDEFKEDEKGCLEQIHYMIEESKNNAELNNYGKKILGYIHRNSKLIEDSNSEKPSWFINDNEIESKDENIESHIGSGSYSYVVKGNYNGAIVAKKVFDIKSDEYEKILRKNINNNNKREFVFIREIEIWNRIKPHPFILHFYGAYHYGRNPFIVSEYCNKGNVRIYTSNDNVTVNEKLQIMHDIAIGLYHLHKSNIIHGDIKSNNVLISNDGTPKICDFGLSVYLSDDLKDKLISTCNITDATRWKAPELFKNYNIGLVNNDINKNSYFYNPKISIYSDIFSLGRLYYEIIAQENPFYEILYNSEVEEKVVSNQYPCRVKAKNSKDDVLCSDKMWDILLKTWNYEPSHRISLLSLASILIHLKTLESNDNMQILENYSDNRIKLNIKFLNGFSINVEVEPTDTIFFVKYKIQELLSHWLLPINRQLLIFEKKELKDEKTISDYNIVNGSTIRMVYHIKKEDYTNNKIKMKIFIQTVSDKTDEADENEIFNLDLEVEQNNYIKKIKHKIEMKQGIPINEQRLYFKGLQLNNDRSLSYYAIEELSILHLRYNKMKLLINIFHNKTIELDVPPNYTILDIKKKVQNKEDIPLEQQRLIYNGIQIDDKKTISSYHILNGSTIHIVPPLIKKNSNPDKIKIFIKTLTGKIIGLEIKPNGSILFIMEKIESIENIPIKQQHLTFNGIQLDYYEKHLPDYNITEGSTLYLTYDKINIFIKILYNKSINFEVEPNDTILNVKFMIQNKEGIPINEQCLNFKGLQLKDEISLSHYDIGEGDTLSLTPYIQKDYKKMKIIFKTLTGYTIDDLEFDATDTIFAVKYKIQEKMECFPIRKQRLFFEHKQLEDEKTLSDYNIKEGSCLFLTPRFGII